ncbi:hypothetical protein [Timonella sp. A28]|uniref:hypothetical protein n=1 Tax=Timonella sp. A28 TaxID=3442640 RepID=UPI003EBBF379
MSFQNNTQGYPSKVHKRPFWRAILLGVLFASLAAFLIWHYGVFRTDVSDAQARELVTDMYVLAQDNPQAVCEHAIFDSTCNKAYDKNTSSIGREQQIICTWPLAGGKGSRAVEVENVDGITGEKYRTSVLVSRDGSQFKAWPAPYWVFPTREIPTQNGPITEPQNLPTYVEQEMTPDFDPCRSAPN